MPDVVHRIVCADDDTLRVDKGGRLFAQMFTAEAMAASKPSQREIVVERGDAAWLAREVAALPEAHERSLGDTSIVVLDAVSAIACANYRSSVVASYDFFDDLDDLAQRTGNPIDTLRSRLYTALSRADKIIVVSRRALVMAWLYLGHDVIQQPLPPLAAYSNPLGDITKPILIVVHEPESAAMRDGAAEIHKGHPNSIVVYAGDELDVPVPPCISLAVHIGRDTRGCLGLRIVDCWWSGIPVIQLAIRTSGFSGDAELHPNVVVSHNETGLRAGSVAELDQHIATVMSDPILYATLVRRSKIEAAKQSHLWKDLVHRSFS